MSCDRRRRKRQQVPLTEMPPLVARRIHLILMAAVKRQRTARGKHPPQAQLLWQRMTTTTTMLAQQAAHLQRRCGQGGTNRGGEALEKAPAEKITLKGFGPPLPGSSAVADSRPKSTTSASKINSGKKKLGPSSDAFFAPRPTTSLKSKINSGKSKASAMTPARDFFSNFLAAQKKNQETANQPATAVRASTRGRQNAGQVNASGKTRGQQVRDPGHCEQH